MAKYDLTNSLETSFTFAVGDNEYTFRKPTVREMRAVAKEFSGLEDENDPEKQVEKSDNAMAELYKFITPIGDAPPIADLLDDQTVDVQKAFNEMIKTELGSN